MAAARTVALVLLHPATTPRAAAATAAESVCAASPELAATLVAGLQHWASHPAAPEVVAVLGDAAGAAQARFASAVVAAAPAEGSVQLSAGLVSALLLLAHHPSVTGAGGGSATWAAVARKLGPVADVLASSPADVAAALVSSPASGAACAEPAQQAAAAGALRAAMALAAAPLFDAVMAALRLLLDSSAHDALSAREVKIYFTPAGERGAGLGASEGVFWRMCGRVWMPVCLPVKIACCATSVQPHALRCLPSPSATQPACRPLLPPTAVLADKLSFENEDGTIMAEEIFQQQLLSYRPIPAPHQLPDCPEERGPSPAAAEAAPAAAATDGAAAGKPAGGRPAPGRGVGRPAAAGGRGGAAAPKSNAAAEARQKQLAGEAEVRAKVVAVRDGLRRGLAALAAVAAGNPAFTAEQVRMPNGRLCKGHVPADCNFELVLCTISSPACSQEVFPRHLMHGSASLPPSPLTAGRVPPPGLPPAHLSPGRRHRRV